MAYIGKEVASGKELRSALRQPVAGLATRWLTANGQEAEWPQQPGMRGTCRLLAPMQVPRRQQREQRQQGYEQA